MIWYFWPSVLLASLVMFLGGMQFGMTKAVDRCLMKYPNIKVEEAYKKCTAIESNQPTRR